MLYKQMSIGPRRQRGVILLIALVMLLLITVVGTGAIGVTTLDTKMASNVRDRQVAFQAAETALFAAEGVVFPTDPNIFPDTNTVGYQGTGLAASWWADSADTTWVSGSGNVGSYVGQASSQYVIELSPTSFAVDTLENVQDIGMGGGVKRRMFYFPLTARGVGPGGASVLVQSTYGRIKDLNN